MNSLDNLWTVVLPEWLSAVGTIGAVFVALFGKPVRNYFNRPKITLTCDKTTPFVEEIKTNPQSSTEEKEIRIRVKLENTGKYTANVCNVCVDCYYDKRDKDDSYCKREFTPVLIKDYRGYSLKDVVPNLIYYLDVASIRKVDEMSKSDDNSKFHQCYKLLLLGDKTIMKLGTGTFVIPLKFYSSKVKTIVTYLKIYWDSDNYTMDDKKFIVSILSQKEFDKLEKK